MREIVFRLIIGSGLAAAPLAAEAASSSSSASASAPSSESAVLGAWYFGERDVTVELYHSANGLLQGKVTASPRPAEVGTWLVRDARWSANDQRFTGRLVTEETGAADAIIDVVTTADGSATLRLVCSRFFLTKTLTWTRAPTKKEAP